jgi:hypothetical protein
VLIRNSWKIFINISSPPGERIKVRGKIMIISTLTPDLSRQRERGQMIHR